LLLPADHAKIPPIFIKGQAMDLGNCAKAEQKPLGKNGFVYKPKYGVIIICADEDEQKAIYERLLAEGLKLRVVVV
jgi:hypothetical protein